MTAERTPPRAAPERASANPAARLARALADRSHWLLPLTVVVGAGTLGFLRSAGAAILILAGGTLLGVITLLWKSLQVLVGEAPLSLEAALDISASTAADEQKHAVLRALKDLEYERGLGKLSDDDYRELSARYRAEAKAVMRSIDETLGPARERAEKLIEAELGAKVVAPEKPKKKKKRADAADAADAGNADDAPAKATSRAPADEPGSPSEATNPLTGTAAATSPIPEAPLAPVAALAALDALTDAATSKTGAIAASDGPAESVNARICPSCSLHNDVDASFCKACGTRLGSAAGTAPQKP
ncbi:MAG: zinc ribbon domain-containing protein [Polyangiaceae bacterium]|jgi:hypothetical protein|nr:zinc ribbon domain-containing protein [Polyangiaceae bacterium]